MRPSVRFREMLVEMGRDYPEARRYPPRVRANKKPTIGYSFSLEEGGYGEDGELRVDISDILLEESPEEVLRAVAHLILLGAHRDAYSSEKSRLFEEHKRRLESDARIAKELLRRDRSINLKTRGRRHDIRERFDWVNSQYFDGKVPPVNLAWSTRVDSSRWGYTDRDRRLIVVNKQLDGPRVPGYVVDYILYHEMLHIVHKGLFSQFGRDDHYVDFYRDERKFDKYQEAEMWLRENL
jgi:hypothetical protein